MTMGTGSQICLGQNAEKVNGYSKIDQPFCREITEREITDLLQCDGMQMTVAGSNNFYT